MLGFCSFALHKLSGTGGTVGKELLRCNELHVSPSSRTHCAIYKMTEYQKMDSQRPSNFPLLQPLPTHDIDAGRCIMVAFGKMSAELF